LGDIVPKSEITACQCITSRPPDRTWRRPPGHPWNKWLNQLQDDSDCSIGDLWRHAVNSGHSGATTWWLSMMMMMMMMN